MKATGGFPCIYSSLMYICIGIAWGVEGEG